MVGINGNTMRRVHPLNDGALQPDPPPLPGGAPQRSFRQFTIDTLARIVHSATWRMRQMEYAWSMVERELASTVQVPWYHRFGMWRRGFLSEARVLYDFSADTRKLYVSDYARFAKTRLINGEYGILLDDKLLFSGLLDDIADHHPMVFGILDGENVASTGIGMSAKSAHLGKPLTALLKEEGALVLKPARGGGGRGVTLFEATPSGIRANGATVSPADLVQALQDCNGHLICERVVQHPALARLYPETVNTLRLITMRDAHHKPFVASVVLRVGSASSRPTDNWSRGGLCAHVDTASGRVGKAVRFPAHSNCLYWYAAHPETGARIEGLRLPNWDRVITGILEITDALSFLEYIGWDIAITEDDFRILEGNNYTNVNLFQIHGPLLADQRIADFYRRHGVISDRRNKNQQ
jgi:hypothetical protein